MTRQCVLGRIWDSEGSEKVKIYIMEAVMEEKTQEVVENWTQSQSCCCFSFRSKLKPRPLKDSVFPRTLVVPESAESNPWHSKRGVIWVSVPQAFRCGLSLWGRRSPPWHVFTGRVDVWWMWPWPDSVQTPGLKPSHRAASVRPHCDRTTGSWRPAVPRSDPRAFSLLLVRLIWR